MAFDIDMPGGIQPSPITPTDPNDALMGLISGFFNDARARVQAQDFGSVFSDMLGEVRNQQGPTPLPVPAPLRPVGQFGGMFASTLADLMAQRFGLNTNAQQAHEAGVAQREEERRTATQQNILRQDEFERSKAAQELQIRMRINEARAQQARELGDLNEYEARLKGQAAMRREQVKMQEESKLKITEATNKAIMERVLAATKERGKQARQTLNYKNLLKTALDTTKAPDAVKAWARIEQQRIFSRDIAGEFIYTPEQQESMAEETYQEFLRRTAEIATGGEQPTGDAFDQFIESLFSE